MKVRLTFIAALASVVASALARAQSATLSEAETLAPPTPGRLAAIHAAAQRDGWAPHVAEVRAAALHAYERDKPLAAAAWLDMYRWSAMFGQTEGEFTTRWINAVTAARVAHENMPTRFELTDRPLGAALTPDFQAWLLGHPAFADEFFAVVSPVDYLPRTFAILDELYRRDAAKFTSYASLALAIAVVYDVPPPPNWPHGQVNTTALPRKFPPPADAFAWWIRQEQLGRTQQRLARLPADELKFVVDAAAPFAELEWAQRSADLPLNSLARAYSMIRYRTDRAANNVGMWPGRTYTLADILAAGGICADQAYFASEVGKARGVPTLLFHGAGNDGRHAWFGFLDGNGQWQLDAGRYAEQRFVTGYARDPQTWRELTDHEIQFLSEHFRLLPSFQQSRFHADFADAYLIGGDAPHAAAAARKAVNYERRNQAAWETLLAAARADHRDAKTIEGLLHEAALAFQHYPDLEASYVNRVAESLRARGETSLADAEIRRIAVKNRDDRTDVSVQEARDIVLRAIATQPLDRQMQTYNSVVDNFGHGAGIAFFDQVVKVFAEHLVQLQQRPEAVRAVGRARRALNVEPKSQLDQEFTNLLTSVQGGTSAKSR